MAAGASGVAQAMGTREPVVGKTTRRLETADGVLLRALYAAGKLLQTLGGLFGAGQRFFEFLGVSVQVFPGNVTLLRAFLFQLLAEFAGELGQLMRRLLLRGL